MEPKKILLKKYIIYSLLSTLLAISVVSIFYRNNVFDRLDLFLYDLHFKWRGSGPSSGRVVLVLMDQKSASELKRKRRAWSRLHLAEALENLCHAGAEIIGIDLVFFSPSHEVKEDLALAKAIEESNNVVLAKFVSVEGRGEVLPLSLFRQGMIGDGFINMFPDKDGVLRKTPFLSVKPLDEGVMISPSFSLELARTYLNLDFVFDFSNQDYFCLGAQGPQQLSLPYPDLRINFLGGEEIFRCLSFMDVVGNQIPSGSVNGKIVLIGSSLATDKDFFTTPLSGYIGRESLYKDKFGKVVAGDIGSGTVGVACHAQALETILSRAFIHKIPGIYVIVFTILLGLFGLVFYLQRPAVLWGAFVLLISQGVILGISHALFVNHLLWIESASLIIILPVQFLCGIGLQRSYNKKKTRFVTNLFGKYVSPAVVNNILEGDQGITLEGRSQVVTVLFSDLRAFTSLSETLSPQETGYLLNTYFDAMIPVVFNHQGTLDKIMGDGIMAFFGAPGDLKDHAVKAAETALEMVRELEMLKKSSKTRGTEKLDVGIGLNTGQVIVGNLGSKKFMDYTVIGDAVNLGSRLEALNKVYGTLIIISRYTADRLDSRFVLRELDTVMVKGKADAVVIFELVGLRNETGQERIKLIEMFRSGLTLYKNRDWNRAQNIFYQALELCPGDGPSRLYLERTKAFLENPPPPEWEAVTLFTTK